MKEILFITILVLSLSGFAFSQSIERTSCQAKLSKEDMEFLLKDAPPNALRSLADPETKKKQIENLRQMLAQACAAKKAGLADDPKTIAELEDIAIQITAVNYDRAINKDYASKPPFAYIDEDRIKKFWNATREAEFQKFFDIKIELAKENGQIKQDREPAKEEIEQARGYFAKTRIYAAEAKAKWNEMPSDFGRKVELAVMLQQTQYLSRLYAEKVLAEKIIVTDEEIEIYLAAHPELDTKAQKAIAEKILQRALAGENFAKLAMEFSEDPGSKDMGGLYKNISLGQMVPEFEQAALGLKPGEISPNLVVTKYGFHIVKLEKKGEMIDRNGEKRPTYDVRHILILTEVKDPNNPLAKMSPRELAQSVLGEEKEKRVLDEVLEENPVEVAEDFEVPIVSDEEMQKLMQQQLQQQIPEEMQEPPKVNNEKLPANIKSYLNRNYKGWKLSPSIAGCGEETNKGVVKGNFNGDKKLDYAVKITRGKKGYIIAFLAQNQSYKAFILHNTDAKEVNYSSLGTQKKGSEFPYGGVNDVDGKSFRLKYDAPEDYHCESDVGGIHYYRNGKFVGY